MMRAPGLDEIYAAELKFAESAQAAVNGTRRVRAAVREVFARPTTLGSVAGAAVLAGFLVGRRPRPRVQFSGRRKVEKDAKPSTLGLVAALAFRQALARLPDIAAQLWATHQQPESPAVEPVAPAPSPVVHPPERVLH